MSSTGLTSSNVFFFMDTPTTQIYTLSLHDALPISSADETVPADCDSAPDGDANTVVCIGPDAAVGETSQLWLTLYVAADAPAGTHPLTVTISTTRSEEHTSELQSRRDLVCRLLLEK